MFVNDHKFHVAKILEILKNLTEGFFIPSGL